jgi:hypothetical protein
MSLIIGFFPFDHRSEPKPLSPRDGCEALVCPDDAEAIEKAKGLVNGHDVEVWSGPRLVAKLTAATAPDGTIQPEDAWPSW